MPHDGSRIEPQFESDELWAEETVKPLSVRSDARTPLSREPGGRDVVMRAILTALALAGSAAVLVAALLF